MNVATSSIIENIRVNNPQALEDYVMFMEGSERASEKRRTELRSSVITDPGRIRSFVEKALAKKGMKL